MEVGFVTGAVPVDWVRREKPENGDSIIILGGATGRDGSRRSKRKFEKSRTRLLSTR